MVREARLEDAEAITKVHIDSWRTTYKGIVPDEFLAKMDYEKRLKDRRERMSKPDPDKGIFVAEDEQGKVVGFAHCGRLRDGDPAYDGELYAIYLYKENQCQGHGKDLLKAVARWLKDHGYKSMLVWVLDENPSKHFYIAQGAQTLDSKTIEIGKPLLETSYGWPELPL